MKKIIHLLGRIFNYLNPPARWRVAVIVTLGFLTGLFVFLFYISKANSYLSDSPETCVNCHIMAPQYATWYHSSHRNVATCNDCHVPQDNIFSHYYFKAKDGLRHATIFTLRKEPQVIYIHKAGKQVVQNNCLRCHSQLFENDKTNRFTELYVKNQMNRNCNECHRETVHGRGNSLSSVPNARIPLPQSPVPDWLKKIMNTK